MRKRVLHRTYHLVIILTLIMSFMPSLMSQELSPVSTSDKAEAANTDNPVESTSSSLLETSSGGGGTDPTAPGRPAYAPPDVECMVSFEGTIFIDGGPGTYPTQFYPVANGDVQDPAWINQDITSVVGDPPFVTLNQRLVLYFSIRNTSENGNPNCAVGGHDVVLRELQVRDRDTLYRQMWNITGTPSIPSADPLANLFWSSGTPGVLNRGQNAWGFMFFDADQVSNVTGLIRFQMIWTMDSCTPGALNGSSCAGAVGPTISAPLDNQGTAVQVRGPRAQLTFIEPTVAPPVFANPDQFVPYILEVNRPAAPTTTQDIVRAEGDPASLPDCGSGTFNDGNPYGWYDGPDPFTATEIDNMALNPPIQTDGPSGVYYCYFRVEMDTALADPVTGQFVFEGDVILTDINGFSETFHVVAPPVTLRIPEVTVTKVIVSPANSGQGISIGGTVTYEVTIRNTGEIPLNQISAIDSLTGPLAIPLNTTLAEDPDGDGPLLGEEIILTTSYTVRANDPSTLVNTVTVTAHLNLPGVNDTVTDTAAASIRVISEDLQVTLVLRSVDGIPYDLNSNTPPPQPGSVLVFTTLYDNRGTINLHDLQYVANYPTYVDAPAPTYVNSVIGAGLILPGLYGDAPSESASTFTYTVPASFPPDPIFQRVRVRAFRPNNTAVFAEALLVVDLTNPNVSITALRYRPGDGPVSDTEAALRGDTLYFSGTITNESALDICGVEIRQYVRNPITGLLTPGNPFVLPASNITWPGPAGTLAPSASADFTGVTYLVNAATPDPLDIVFEVYAPQQGSPTCAVLSTPLVDRTTVSVDISDVQISAFIQARRVNDNAIVAYGLYPPPELAYRFIYVATNVGGIQFTIDSLNYCVVGFPMACDSAFPSTAPNFMEPDNVFTPFQTRTDEFTITLLEEDVAEFVNPLQVEVILNGTDAEGRNIVLRTLLQFPLISSELPGTLTGPLNTLVAPPDRAQDLLTSLVRGDANVPFQFTFENETNTVLENVYIVNLLENSVTPQVGYYQVGAFGFNDYYELCTVTGLSGGGTPNPTGPNTMQPNEIISGTCYFTYATTMPSGDFQMQVLAVANRVVDPTQRLISVVTWGIREVPHLRALKLGPGSAVATEPIEYTVEIYNQSMYQYVDFNPSNGFTDVIQPELDPSTLQPPNFTIDASWTGLVTNATDPTVPPVAPGLFRLLAPSNPTSPASGTYQRNPPGGQFPDTSYRNDVTVTGTAQSGLIVSATAAATVAITCPLGMLGFYGDIPGDPFSDTDAQFTLGERQRFTFFIINISNVPINLTSAVDELYNRENQLGPGTAIYPQSFTWDDPSQPGVIPVDGFAVYEYDVILRPEDYPDGTDPQRIFFTTEVTIANPPPNCDVFDILWYFDSPNPVTIEKTVTPSLVFPGNAATYDIQLTNVSEVSDMQVTQVVDDLLSQSPLVMDFTSASPDGQSGILEELGEEPPGSDDNSAVLLQNGQQNYIVQADDPPTLTNEATVYYYPMNGPTSAAPGTVNVGPPGTFFVPMATGPNALLSNSDEASIGTASPLSCIMVPSQTDVPAGGLVDILITLVNGSTDFDITAIQFTVVDEAGNVILTNSSAGVPAPLDLTPANRQFSINVSYIVPAGWSEPTITIDCTARGVFSFNGELLPDSTTSIRLNVDAPELLLEMVVFADSTCPRIDGPDLDTLPDLPDPDALLPDEVPEFPLTPDGIPEATVSQYIYYGILLQNTSLGLNFQNIAIDQASLNNGLSLTADVSAQLNALLPSRQLAPGEQVALCIPYQIVDQTTDPLIHTLQVAAESVAPAPPNSPPTPFTLQVVATVDIEDSNIRIFKTALPTVSFPGDVVEYTLYIQNRNNTSGDTLDAVLLLDDVWDSLLGGPLTGASFCGNTATPPVNIPPANLGVCNPALTSIRFDDIADGLDPYGWTWPDNARPGVLFEGESASYRYLYTVQEIDPNPLINNAGVRAVLYDANDSDITSSNWEVQVDLVGDPIQPTDETFASVAITDSQLLVIKDGPATALAGSSVQYTVTVVNIGDVEVANVRVRDEQYNLDRGLFPGTYMPMTECFRDTADESVTLERSVGSLVCQYTIVMPTAEEIENDPSQDPYINTAFATGQVSNGGQLVPLPNEGSDTAIVDILVPDLFLDKIPSVGSAAIGDTVTYRIIAENTGDVPLRLDQIVDVPPPPSVTPAFSVPSVRINSTDQSPTSCGVTGTSNNLPVVLAPGDVACATVSLVIPNPAPASEYVNTVRVYATVDPGVQNRPLVDSTSGSVDVRNLGIVVEKQAYDCDPLVCPNPQIITSINEGVTYYYGITVTNTGDAPLDMIEWRDPLYLNNAWQQVVNAFDTNDLIDPTDTPELEVNETFVIASYSFEANYARDGALLTNRVDARGRESTTGNFTPIRSDTTQVIVLPTALQITKRACVDISGNGTPPASFNPCPVNTPAAVRPGGTIWYEVTIANPSATVTVINVEVTDTLQGVWAAGPDTLGPGDEVTWVYEGAPVSAALTNVVNTVTVNAESNGSPISSSDSVSVPVALGELSVLITEDSGRSTAEVGDLLNFTVLVQNLSSTQTISFINVGVPFYSPDFLNLVAFDLAPGTTSVPFRFQYTVTPADNTMVFAAIAQGILQGNQITAQSSWTVTRSVRGMAVTKTADTNYASLGDTVNYTITITNDSGEQITGLTVSDPLLQNLPAWTSPAWPSTIAPGQSLTRTFAYVIGAPIPSNPILNTVTVTGTVNAVVTTVQAGPVAVYIPDGDLLVTNTPSVLDALVGDIVSFTYRICNLADGTPTPPNNQPITSITLTDNLGPITLPGFDFSLDPGECYETARLNVELFATDVPVYTMSVTATGSQFDGVGDVALAQTVSRDVNVRQPGQNLMFNVTAVPNPVVYPPAGNVQFNFTLQNIGTTAQTITGILDNSPTPGGLCQAYSPVPTAPIYATLDPGEILAFTCSYAYTGTLDPIDGIWTANMASGDTATSTISVPVVADPTAAIIISQVETNPTVGVPGGLVTYTYHVRNVSGATVLDVRLDHDPANDLQCAWSPVDFGSNPLWLGTASLAVAAEMTAQATCDISTTAAPGSTATHVIEAYIGAAVTPVDTATINTLIQPPLTVSAPTSAFTANPGTNITAWQVGTGYEVNISFDITNSSNSLQVTGIVPEMLVDGTAVCAGGFQYSLPANPNPITFNGTLNPNATIRVTCLNYTPTVALAPLATVDVAATGFVQGVSISDDATADFPVYNLGFTVELTADPTAADIDGTVNFTLALTNTGTSPLFLPPATQDPVTTGRLDNPTAPDVLGDLYAALNTVCFSSGSLAPGASCVLAYNDPALTNDELTYIIDQTDPATITFLVGITLWSNQPVAPATAPAFEIANQDTVEITVNQPVVPAINAFGLAANPNPGVVGNQIVFTASIQNSGTQVLTNLTATLQLTQLSFTNAVGDNGGIVLTGGHNQTPLPTITMIINDADGTLNPGEVATATGYWVADRIGSFRATLTATGRAGTTQATATDTELLEFRINSSAIATATPITPGAITPTATTATTDPDGNPLDPNALDPTITKTVTPESALPGQDVTFTVTITNGSTTAMANVTVTDNMPLELTINNATTSVGASVVSGQLITVTTGQLNPGQRITVVIIARVNDDVSIPSLITNDACAAVTGRTQVCASVELPIGADAEALPTTGQGEPESADLDIATQGVAGVASRPFGVAPLLMLGLLALLSTGQINRQRWLLGGLAVLIIAIIAGALVLVGSGDEQDDTTGTPQVVLPPGVTPTASPTLDRAPTLTPLATGESLESPVAPTPLDAPPTLRPSPTPYIPPTPSGDRRLDIPKLNFTDPVPIVELPYSDAAWDVSNLGHSVGWLEKTTWMAPTWGNTVLVAHVQLANDDPGPFKRLNELEVGDDIYVYDGPYKYAFRVTEITTVNATAIEVTHPTVDPVLTLLTCTNWDFARGVYADRLIIRAAPLLNVN
ncbi:MAG: hypothetical protein DPW16_19790 [Chloroflexi bacterium]|nr:hypothetical protein [Chloroflexota bacterium]